MMNTGISKHKDGYVPPKTDRELFRDGRAIQMVQDITTGATDSNREPEADFAMAMEGVMALMNKLRALQEENKLLREENAILQQQVNKLQNDELCKVVNLDTIAKYCLRQTHPKTVQIIVNMLNRLCVGKGCVPERLQTRIEELENHIMALENPQPSVHHNHGCQNFYGEITQSNFPSKY
jgi:polyhydroxyalkanoate synthesis regulator phasin